MRETEDFFGKNVILASRIADQSQGWETLVSALLKELTDSAGDIRFGEEREVEVKGLTGLNRVNSVILEERSLFDAVRREILEALVDPFLIHPLRHEAR